MHVGGLQHLESLSPRGLGGGVGGSWLQLLRVHPALVRTANDYVVPNAWRPRCQSWGLGSRVQGFRV